MLRLTRRVTKKECPWLSRPFRKGEIVYRYDGCTYGCIASGIACTERDGKTPFFELPQDAVMDEKREVKP